MAGVSARDFGSRRLTAPHERGGTDVAALARYFSARPLLLLLLLTADFVFIAVHVWLWTKGNVPWDHHLGRDGSNPEKLQYVKWLTSTLLCAWAFARSAMRSISLGPPFSSTSCSTTRWNSMKQSATPLRKAFRLQRDMACAARISGEIAVSLAPPRYCSV
jgi:hypothetical protein